MAKNAQERERAEDVIGKKERSRHLSRSKAGAIRKQAYRVAKQAGNSQATGPL